MKYYSAIRKHEILHFVTTHDVMLSEISCMEKDKNYMIQSYVGYKRKQKAKRQSKHTQRHRQQYEGYQRGRGRGRVKRVRGSDIR